MEECIATCERMIRRGYRKESIKNKLTRCRDFDEVYEIARCRIRAKDKFTIHNLYFDEYGLRYSTPELIGRYRAERIKNMKIADLSCGVGLQAIFYSFSNREVLGVDINERRINYARKNAEAYGAKNIKFVVGDCLSDEIARRVRDYDVLFSDPARDESEAERRLETLKPSPLKIMERYGERNYVFDLPPQISLDKIPSGWEKEFISLNGRITRFTVYTGDLKKHDRSAVSLPSGEVMWSDEAPMGYEGEIRTNSNVLSDYIYIVDESIYYARLLWEFSERYGLNYLRIGKRRTLATGDDMRVPFTRAFRVLCRADTLEEVVQCMRECNIGKATLRFDIPPHQYWATRKKIEKKLSGEKKGSIFRIGDAWIGAENVT